MRSVRRVGGLAVQVYTSVGFSSGYKSLKNVSELRVVKVASLPVSQ
jgi:hypothetical protein